MILIPLPFRAGVYQKQDHDHEQKKFDNSQNPFVNFAPLWLFPLPILGEPRAVRRYTPPPKS